MSFFGKLIGAGLGTTADGIASAINQFVETTEEKKAADILLRKVKQNPAKWQTEINKVEAGHRTLFVAGWRPAVGWICVIALGWGWILAPILQFFYPDRTMPAIEVAQAVSLVMAMLGMGSLRAYEKKQGLTK